MMETLLQRAQHAFQNQHYQIVVKLLLPHANDNNTLLNHLLVKSLYYQRQYVHALQYAREMINSYSNNSEDFKLLVKLLLLNNVFVQARILVKTVKASSFKEKLQLMIEQREQWVRIHLHSNLLELQKQMYHLTSDQISTQKRTLQNAYHLPLKEFVNGARFLLKNPFISPVLSSELIDILLELGVNQTIDFYGLDDQIHSVDLTKLMPLEQTISYQEIMNEINQQFGSDDNFTARYLINTFKMYLLYLYPLNDQVVKKPKLWIQIAMRSLNNQPLDDDEETRTILKWQQKLNHITEQLSLH